MTHEQQVSSQPILLGLLLYQPSHGYELYQEFSRELGCVWQMGRSQLYAQLKALEEGGLVTSHTEPQPNRPPRKVYDLTAKGRQAFDEWLHQPTPYLRTIRVEFLARLYFFRRLSLPGLERLVAEQKAVCRDQSWRFKRIAARTDDEFRRLVLDFRRGQLEATVAWLDRCLERQWSGRETGEP